MNLSELFRQRTVFSFEVFPPKRTAPVETIYHTLDELKPLAPDFISVTYGAGGSESSGSTIEISSAIRNDYGIESVAHLTCIHQTKQEVREILATLKEKGVRNVLALRGDRHPDHEPKQDFAHASDLVAFIREQGDFHIIGACYPEGHNEAASLSEDIRNLRRKVDAGANHLISQLFFDNQYFYSFLDRAQCAGIDVPIEAGIMPVVNRKQIERMVTLCGVQLPKKFSAMMSRYENNPEAMRDAGIAYAVDQIVDLASQGVSGIHLYTMNNGFIARRIHESVRSLFEPAATDPTASV